MWRCTPDFSPGLRNCMYASTHISRVFSFSCTRCLISPSADCSHGMSSASTTLLMLSYCLRNSCDALASSARKVAVFVPDSAGPLSVNTVAMAGCLDCAWRLIVPGPLGGNLRRPFHHLPEQQVHEQE